MQNVWVNLCRTCKILKLNGHINLFKDNKKYISKEIYNTRGMG